MRTRTACSSKYSSALRGEAQVCNRVLPVSSAANHARACVLCNTTPMRFLCCAVLCCACPTAGVERRGLSQAIVRMRKLTSELPPCLFVPHTVAAWCSPATGQAVVAGEALATVGVCTLAALLQGVSVLLNEAQIGELSTDVLYLSPLHPYAQHLCNVDCGQVCGVLGLAQPHRQDSSECQESGTINKTIVDYEIRGFSGVHTA